MLVENYIPLYYTVFMFTIQIGLSPWANYTFHVKAKNSLGMSERSEFTGVVCKTQADKPLKNPDGVCTDGRDPSELVIIWKVCMFIVRTVRSAPNIKSEVSKGQFIQTNKIFNTSSVLQRELPVL